MSWIQRIGRFSRLRFPLFPNVILLSAHFLVTFFFLRKLIAATGRVQPPPPDPWVCFTGCLCFVLFSYLFRCYDEGLDYESDKVHFPDRPLVAGWLSFKDLDILNGVTLSILLVAHAAVLTSWATRACGLALLGFIFLAGRWFFLDRTLRENLSLSFFLHQPISYLHELYILSFFGFSGSIATLPVILVLVANSLPLTAWEIARKIRGTSQETRYATYTLIWGPLVPPAAVAVLMGLSQLVFSFATAFWLRTPRLLWAFFPGALIWLYFLGQTARFRRDAAVAPRFQSSLEIFRVSQLLGMMIAAQGRF